MAAGLRRMGARQASTCCLCEIGPDRCQSGLTRSPFGAGQGAAAVPAAHSSGARRTRCARRRGPTELVGRGREPGLLEM